MTSAFLPWSGSVMKPQHCCLAASETLSCGLSTSVVWPQQLRLVASEPVQWPQLFCLVASEALFCCLQRPYHLYLVASVPLSCGLSAPMLRRYPTMWHNFWRYLVCSVLKFSSWLQSRTCLIWKGEGDPPTFAYSSDEANGSLRRAALLAPPTFAPPGPWLVETRSMEQRYWLQLYLWCTGPMQAPKASVSPEIWGRNGIYQTEL